MIKTAQKSFQPGQKEIKYLGKDFDGLKSSLVDFAKTYYPSIGIKVLGIEKNNVVTDQGTFKRFSKEELKNIAEDVSTDYQVVELNQIFYLLNIKV